MTLVRLERPIPRLQLELVGVRTLQVVEVVVAEETPLPYSRCFARQLLHAFGSHP
jgi:hypothetical protein